MHNITTKKEIIDDILNNRQINELPLEERRIVNGIHASVESLVKKLNEELNKIDNGMGELDAIVNAASIKYLNSKIKDTVNEVSK